MSYFLHPYSVCTESVQNAEMKKSVFLLRNLRQTTFKNDVTLFHCSFYLHKESLDSVRCHSNHVLEVQGAICDAA
jgi:hypothetical protein